MTTTFERIKVDRIAPHARNVRHDLGDLDELADSIKGMGVLQPLIVAPVPVDAGEQRQAATLLPQRYIVIAGHRRLAAAAKAGVDSVPCLVRDDLDTQAKVITAMVAENVMRADLTVMEEADAYAQLELLGVKEAGIAKATGRSRATVHQRLLLASLPTERRGEYEDGSLSLDGAVECARLRQRWADDSEILAEIDKASTWAFGGSGYSIDHSIARILEDRKRVDEPEPEDDDEGTIDYAGKRAEREAEWEKQRQERAERGAKIREAATRMHDWLSGRIAAKDDTVARRLIAWAIEDALDEYQLDDALPIVGIEPAGEDEDVDDANQRIAAAAKALSGTDQMVLLALAITGAETLAPYNYADHARQMAVLGYTLTADDKALMGEES